MVAGGGGRLWPWRWRRKLGRRLGQWWSALWGLGVAQGSFYRPSKAVELGGAWMEAGERCGAP